MDRFSQGMAQSITQETAKGITQGIAQEICQRIEYIGHIPVTPKKDMVMIRLGYKKGVTELDEKYLSMVDEGMKLGGALCRPSGAYVSLKIEDINDSCVLLENGIEFRSCKLSEFLRDSQEVVLMASTVGTGLIDEINNQLKAGNAAKALILDSVASQTADAILDSLMDILNNKYVKEGRKLTKHRYSPGYGDLPLSYQKVIFDILKLEELGMQITEKFMLVPEKSVIAIAGVLK